MSLVGLQAVPVLAPHVLARMSIKDTKEQPGWIYVWSYLDDSSIVRVGHIKGESNDRSTYTVTCHVEAIQYRSRRNLLHLSDEQKIHAVWACESNVQNISQAVSMQLEANFSPYINNFDPANQDIKILNPEDYNNGYEGVFDEIVKHVQLVYETARERYVFAQPSVESSPRKAAKKHVEADEEMLPEIDESSSMALNELVRHILTLGLPINLEGDRRTRRVAKRIKYDMQAYLEHLDSPDMISSEHLVPPLSPSLYPILDKLIETDNPKPATNIDSRLDRSASRIIKGLQVATDRTTQTIAVVPELFDFDLGSSSLPLSVPANSLGQTSDLIGGSSAATNDSGNKIASPLGIYDELQQADGTGEGILWERLETISNGKKTIKPVKIKVSARIAAPQTEDAIATSYGLKWEKIKLKARLRQELFDGEVLLWENLEVQFDKKQELAFKRINEEAAAVAATAARPRAYDEEQVQLNWERDKLRIRLNHDGSDDDDALRIKMAALPEERTALEVEKTLVAFKAAEAKVKAKRLRKALEIERKLAMPTQPKDADTVKVKAFDAVLKLEYARLKGQALHAQEVERGRVDEAAIAVDLALRLQAETIYEEEAAEERKYHPCTSPSVSYTYSKGSPEMCT